LSKKQLPCLAAAPSFGFSTKQTLRRDHVPWAVVTLRMMDE